MPDLDYIRVFLTPEQSRVQMLLARKLTEWIKSPDVLVWFTSWTGFSDDEMALFQEFRAFWGESRRLIDAPGHLFSFEKNADTFQCVNLLHFMMAFEFEAFVLQDGQEAFLRMDDGAIWTVTHSLEKDLQVEEILDSLNIYERDLTSLPDVPALGMFWGRNPRPSPQSPL